MDRRISELEKNQGEVTHAIRGLERKDEDFDAKILKGNSTLFYM